MSIILFIKKGVVMIINSCIVITSYLFQASVIIMRVYFSNENRYYDERPIQGEFKKRLLTNKEMFSDFVIECINYYVKIKSYITNTSINLYNNCTLVKVIIDKAQFTRYIIVSYIKKNFYSIQSEPIYEDWISLSQLIKEPIKNEPLYGEPQFQYIETYYNITDCDIDIIEQIVDALFSDLFNKKQLENLLIIKNIDGYYISHIIKSKKDISTVIKILINGLKQTKSPFLTIEYSHPKMQKTIPIDINKGYFSDNNQILSPLFIKRYLEYQGQPYYFDLDYKINIMDKNINTVELYSNDYVELREKGYNIISLR